MGLWLAEVEGGVCVADPGADTAASTGRWLTNKEAAISARVGAEAVLAGASLSTAASWLDVEGALTKASPLRPPTAPKLVDRAAGSGTERSL